MKTAPPKKKVNKKKWKIIFPVKFSMQVKLTQESISACIVYGISIHPTPVFLALDENRDISSISEGAVNRTAPFNQPSVYWDANSLPPLLCWLECVMYKGCGSECHGCCFRQYIRPLTRKYVLPLTRKHGDGQIRNIDEEWETGIDRQIDR